MSSGIEQPDNWQAGPTFGQEAMMACPSCETKTRQFGSTQYCDNCNAEWHKTGGLKRRPPDCPDGILFVWEDEKIAPGDIPVWGGKGLKRGNIIEF